MSWYFNRRILDPVGMSVKKWQTISKEVQKVVCGRFKSEPQPIPPAPKPIPAVNKTNQKAFWREHSRWLCC